MTHKIKLTDKEKTEILNLKNDLRSLSKNQSLIYRTGKTTSYSTSDLDLAKMKEAATALEDKLVLLVQKLAGEKHGVRIFDYIAIGL